jgi:hypothetical protein
MTSRACVELVWDAFVEQLLVEVAIYLKKEIFCTTVDYDIKGFRLQQVGKVDYGIVLPVIRIFLYAS